MNAVEKGKSSYREVYSNRLYMNGYTTRILQMVESGGLCHSRICRKSRTTAESNVIFITQSVVKLYKRRTEEAVHCLWLWQWSGKITSAAIVATDSMKKNQSGRPRARIATPVEKITIFRHLPFIRFKDVHYTSPTWSTKSSSGSKFQHRCHPSLSCQWRWSGPNHQTFSITH